MNNRICLNDLVERSAKSPHLPAYESGGWGLSYGQLLTRARVLAAALEQLWPGEGPILLYGHKQPALPVGMLACLLAGRAYVPCDESWPAARVETVFRQAGAAALLFADEAPAPWPEELPAAPLWPMCEPGIIEPLAAPRPCSPEQTAYILFSSGSTGRPKGIPVPRRALANFARWITARLALTLAPGETVVGQAGFSFDLSLADLTLAFCGQGRLVSLSHEELANPALLFRQLSASGDARFSGGWYRTGDSGFVKGGHVWCTGRLDDQLKYCGWRIEPGEVEAALHALPGVERAAVLPQRSPDGRVRRLCAFLQAAQSARLPEEEVRRLLAQRLPAYMLPGRLFWLDELPVTENGKCDRTQLAREFLL